MSTVVRKIIRHDRGRIWPSEAPINSIKFAVWLEHGAPQGEPFVHWARFILGAGEWPYPSTLRALEQYMIEQGASPEVQAGARRMWHQFEEKYG